MIVSRLVKGACDTLAALMVAGQYVKSLRAPDQARPGISSATQLDYAGGILASDIAAEEFFARLEASDAFLVLIDRQTVLRALAGDEKAGEALDIHLDRILGHVQDHVLKPLHFVLTKWDLLEGRHSLQEVVEILSRNQNFQGILEQRRRGGSPTRLIPVSTVGKGFAKLSSEGRMVKISGARAQPENVDLPISCLLFDLVSTAQARIDNERLRVGLMRRLWYRITGSSALLVTVGNYLVDKLPIPVSPDLFRHLLRSALRELGMSTHALRAQMKDKYGQAVLEVRSAHQAFDAIVNFHGYELHWLRKQFPPPS